LEIGKKVPFLYRLFSNMSGSFGEHGNLWSTVAFKFPQTFTSVTIT